MNHHELVADLKEFIRTAEEMRSYKPDDFVFTVNEKHGFVTVESTAHEPHPDDFTYLRKFATLYDYVNTEAYSGSIVLEPMEQAKNNAERLRLNNN